MRHQSTVNNSVSYDLSDLPKQQCAGIRLIFQSGILRHSVTEEPVSSQNKFLLIERLSFCCSIFFPPSSLLTNIKEIQKETKASTTYQRFLAKLNLSNSISYLMNSSRTDVKERVDLYLYSPLCLNGRLQVELYISRLGSIIYVLVTALKVNVYFLCTLLLHFLAVSLSFVYMQRWYIEYAIFSILIRSLFTVSEG